jgi:glycosyltransferase involved in cell wall biosynthesis
MIIYSIIVPIYNDGYLAEDFCTEFRRVFMSYLGREAIESEVELIFVNDGSTNDSINILEDLCKRFPFCKVIDLSRNFGQHIALSCGYKHSSGQYTGMLNADMQDPPDQLPVLIDFLKSNRDYDIVFGLRNVRYSSWRDKITSYLFNLTLNKLTGNNTPSNVATIRVMSRRFVDAYNQLTEKSRYLPGLESWLGFRHGYVPTVHQERKKGRSSYNFRRRMRLAFDSIISFSDLPLKLIALFGIGISIIGFGLIFFLLISKLFFVNYQPGYTSTVSIIVFVGGIQIMVTGLAAIYIGRILKEVQNRPLYVVKEKINF